MATAKTLADTDVSAQGAGRVDLATATTTPVVPDTASLNLGAQQWPHDDFMYTNLGYTVNRADPNRMEWDNLFIPRAGFDGVFSAQVGAADTGGTFQGDIDASWARASADGYYLDSPYAYYLGWITNGSLPTGLTRHLRPSDLAVVKATYHGPTNRVGRIAAAPQGAAGTVSGYTLSHLPAQRTNYYYNNAGTTWSLRFAQIDTSTANEGGIGTGEVDMYERNVGLQAGRTYCQSWNHGVLGPALGDTGPDSIFGARRTADDHIRLSAGLLVDPAGQRNSYAGKTFVDSGRTSLYRNGEIYSTSEVYGVLDAAVPADDAEYRLEASADRSSWAAISTRFSVAWTFRSQHQDTTLRMALPLMSVRYSPTLDEQYAAPAGQTFQIPVRVDHQPGSTGGTVTALTVEVSYDDGATWQAAAVTGSGSQWTATVNHPAGDGHVSLRATATDDNGGKVEQTIIRAYLLHADN